MVKLFDYLSSNKGFAFAIQAGIGGSFSRNYPIGKVVNIKTEDLGDLGIETHKSFKTVSETGMGDETVIINTNSHPALAHLESVDAITVAMACGTQRTADIRREKFNAVIESMEGVTFFMLCNMFKIPYFEIRAISNYCGPHIEGEWDIPLAVNNLTTELVSIIKKLEDEI